MPKVHHLFGGDEVRPHRRTALDVKAHVSEPFIIVKVKLLFVRRFRINYVENAKFLHQLLVFGGHLSTAKELGAGCRVFPEATGRLPKIIDNVVKVVFVLAISDRLRKLMLLK